MEQVLLRNSSNKLSILLIVICFLISKTASTDDVTDDVFGGKDADKDVFPVAFTDYDGDKRTDLVVLTKNFSSFRIYFGSNQKPTLQYQPGAQCDIVVLKGKAVFPVTISGLSVADFTGDGINDILVTFTYSASPSESDVTFLSIFKGGLNNVRCEPLNLNKTAAEPNNTRLILQREPLIVDVNGDMIADLVGETLEGRRIWMFHKDGIEAPLEVNFQCSGDCLPIVTGGFVDIDGDFAPNLVLVTKAKTDDKLTAIPHYIEIYDIDRTVSPHKFNLRGKIIDLKLTIQHVGNALFLDINLTGKEHYILLPFCHDKECHNSAFAIVNPITRKVDVLKVSFSDDHGNNWQFITSSIHAYYLKSINVHAGDYDLDGYPDLIATLQIRGKSQSEADTQAVLFKNIPCNAPAGVCPFPRTFEPNFSLLRFYKNVIGSAFFDSNENGLLDIIGIRRTSPWKDGKGTNETYALFVNQNSPEYDAYFVKWIVTSGICDKICPPYGVMLPGGTMVYSTTGLDNNIRSSRASQVYRNNFALDIPGCIMGIGASANFIDSITFGGINQRDIFNKKQIIPNSNLIAIPRKDGNNIKWYTKQILRPKGNGILATFHVLLFIGFLNASIVFFLHMKERKMDRIERNSDPLSMSALTMS